MNLTPKVYSYTRFSSEKQRHGDSVRRQMEAVEEWCRTEANGLTLDTSLSDEGVTSTTQLTATSVWKSTESNRTNFAVFPTTLP